MDTDLAHGGTSTAVTPEVLNGLNDLLRLDHDAVGAYDVAIEKLENRDYAAQITGYRLDHERHIRDLNALITQLGGTPINEPHAIGPLKKALQSLGGMAGDKGLLVAWRANELAARARYDSYAAKAVYWPNEVKRLVDRNALDVERHFRWVAELLATMGIGSGGDREIDAIDRIRERAESIGHGPGTSGMRDMTGRADALRETVETQVRDNPARTLLAAFAAGFVIGRILR